MRKFHSPFAYSIDGDRLQKSADGSIIDARPNGAPHSSFTRTPKWEGGRGQMSDKEHIWIPKLKQQLADKKIDRREFVRYASLLGMSSATAYMWAGKITGEPFAPPAMAAEMPKGGI